MVGQSLLDSIFASLPENFEGVPLREKREAVMRVQEYIQGSLQNFMILKIYNNRTSQWGGSEIVRPVLRQISKRAKVSNSNGCGQEIWSRKRAQTK